MTLTSMNTVYLGACTRARRHVWVGRVHLQEHAGVRAHKGEPQVSKGPEAEEVAGSSLQPSLLLESRTQNAMMPWHCRCPETHQAGTVLPSASQAISPRVQLGIPTLTQSNDTRVQRSKNTSAVF